MQVRWFHFAVVFLGASVVVAGDSAADLKASNGVWTPTEAVVGGQKLPDEALKTIKLTLKDGNYVVNVGDQSDKGTYKVDATKQPRHMDITGVEGPNKGKTILCIYEIKGDMVRVCYDLGGANRPTMFESPAGSKIFLATYKRQK